MTERTWAALGLVWCCAACEPRTSREQCDQLLDRYVEKLVTEEHPEASLGEIVQRQMQARELAHADPRFEFERCPDTVRASQFDCAMNAHTVNGIEQCLIL